MKKPSKFISDKQRKAVMAKFKNEGRQVLRPETKKKLVKTAKHYDRPIVLYNNPAGYRVDNKETRDIKQDRKRKALPPGKRMSKNGKIYYEYRANRSDKDYKKGI